MSMVLGLRGRLILTYLLLVILGVGGLVIRFGLLEQARIIDKTENDLEIRAFLLASVVDDQLEEFIDDEGSYASFARDIDRLSENVDARLTVLTVPGQPIYDNQVNFRDIPNQLDQVEVQHALQYTEQHQFRQDPLTGVERLYVAAVVRHEDEARGVIQLSIPAAPIWAEIRQSWFILISTALVMVLAVILASLWLANYILRPLKTIQIAATQLAGGDLEQRLQITGRDELSDLARAFNHMAAQLNQMITQQRQFVANASHELRTPLTNIKLRAEALLDGARNDPIVSEKFLTDIELEADHMARLTHNLLALSRFDTGKGLVDPQALDFGPLLAETATYFSPLARTKQLHLTLEAPPSLPLTLADEEEIRQVFDNLVGNALKYTPAGGSVTVTARQSENGITVTVADTGEGIPAEDVPHIFERFYRVDKARTRSGDPGGSGLGLSIVQGIVQAHQGTINVTSQPGRGTTFTLYFPLLS